MLSYFSGVFSVVLSLLFASPTPPPDLVRHTRQDQQTREDLDGVGYPRVSRTETMAGLRNVSNNLALRNHDNERVLGKRVLDAKGGAGGAAGKANVAAGARPTRRAAMAEIGNNAALPTVNKGELLASSCLGSGIGF